MRSDAVFEEKYKNLNKRQKEAVDAIYGPVMVVAGPGTGKTTILTLRIANILKQTDADPGEILALTFTDSGVKAMRQKLREIIGDASFRVHIYTFHSFANYMRAIYPDSFKRIGQRLPANDADQIEIIEEILDKKSFKELRVSTFGVKIKDIIKRISELKREYISADDLKSIINVSYKKFKDENLEEVKTKTKALEIERKEKYFKRMFEFQEVYVLYEKELEKRKIYDYDDTIVGLIDALKEDQLMAQEMRETFQFVLADEHQDANGSQNKILEFFKDDNSLDEPNLFVVGDDKQSIFRFQGASLENFFHFRDTFKGASKINLEENYRSQKLILDLSHSFISHDGRDHTKLLAKVIHKEEKIKILEFVKEENEYKYIAKNIKEKLKEIKDSDTVAILARNNSTLFKIASYLDSLEIPFALKGEQSFFESFEYQKIYTLLSLLNNPLEDALFLKTLYFGFFKISFKDILLLEDVAKTEKKKVSQVFLDFKKYKVFDDKENFDYAQKLYLELVKVSKEKPILEFLKVLNQKLNTPKNFDGRNVLKVLFEESEKLVLKKRHAVLSDLLYHLHLLEEHGVLPLVSVEESNSRVILSSIHKSKGLEYDFVYIVSVNDKNFEKKSRKTDLLQIPGIGIDKELEEERRLLYVALTRAKKGVTISFSTQSETGSELSPSILLDELRDDLHVRELIDEDVNINVLENIKKRDISNIKKLLRERFLNRPFAVTSLNNFLECPNKYFVRNLLLIPDIKEFNALLGTACHSVLKRFHLKKKRFENVSKKEIEKYIEEEVNCLPFNNKDIDLAFEKVTEYINGYINFFREFGIDDDVSVEESISVPFTFEYNYQKYEIGLTGKIDLSVTSNEITKVIDFKSKKKMTEGEIKGNTKNSSGNEYRQLQFYKLLLDSKSKNSFVKEGSLVFLGPEKGRSSESVFSLSEDDFQSISELVSKVLSEIYSFEFIYKNCENKKCEFCELAQLINFDEEF